jgi:Protein of unknown function (DUF2800)
MKVQEFKEVRMAIDLGEGINTFGTVDAVYIRGKEAIAIDYKTGYGKIEDCETNAQAAAYTLGLFQAHPEVETLEFYFVIPNRQEISTHTFVRSRDEDSIRLRLNTIIRRAISEDKTYNPQPLLCEYCANQASCPSLANKALLIAKRYTEDGFPIPDQVHGSKNPDPDEIAQLLRLAPIMETWASGVRKAALDMSLTQGIEIPGFKRMERSGSRKITNALSAYDAVKDTVRVEDFLAACTGISVPQLEEFFAQSQPRGKKAKAKFELECKLKDAGALEEGATVHLLKAVKD